ncbi:type I glyceraldehyde-3-phosphate dehydrogenase [Ichthyenterobacterium sp. W332]|uniref:Type I glyceraldehyde-3-phosphate dehydrogenase n=1 Tax=Microcosmobacter mediterraneus TaxID=3075607 RepID=A0ABU2YJI6_9FLAO|nr:type I glyceraldehyde-3-phosphate dehydrogenase [Ichthyenterobacterium sp. W332]MDT0558316.1 type I glyceraldehyde-3-phosphate dehydrogenase [Ichthyenterobacterium sp. W332]
MIRVGINGFGRIGRRLFRLIHGRSGMEVVAINDLSDSKTLSHLFKYDSIHGILNLDVSFTSNSISVDNKSVAFTNHDNPKAINWSIHNVDIVIEATGKFKTKPDLMHHINNGAQQVILSVPPINDDIKTVVLGVNDHIINGDERIISNASCTTNNAAPMMAIIDDLCGIEQAYITTIHSYTTDQSLHDQPHRDLRRARAAGQSIVPTTTGAAKALTKIFPHLSDVIGGCGIRVPVINGSLTDITFNVNKTTTVNTINNTFKKAANTHLKGILEYTEDPIVSVDILGNTNSCVFDALMTSVIGNMVKIVGWYDNETAYSSRILELICNLSDKKALLSNK